MNARINELATQAELPLLDVDGKCKYGDTYFSKEKFAELIIRECAGLNFKSTGQVTTDGEIAISDLILNHFGVTE